MGPLSQLTTDEPDAEYAVLGDNHIGTAVARRLADLGHHVTVVSESTDTVDGRGVQGDPTDLETLARADVADASTVVVATRTDSQNLLVAQLVRTHFDVATVVVLTNEPDRIETVEKAGHDPVCATSAIADAIVDDL